MGVFSGLSERLSHIFSKIKNKGAITELEVKAAMREIKIALLEADVNVMIVKKFIENVSQKAVGEQVLKSITPTQQIIKIVADELTVLMGSANVKLNPPNKRIQIIMMCGLQGAGKTTLCGKLANMLKGQGKKVLLAACDIYRPAAIDQLGVVAKQAGAIFYEEGKKDPAKIAKNAIAKAEKELLDVVILDTAGRLQIDKQLMQELVEVKKASNPCEILLVVDSMTGQEAANVAKEFNDTLGITGVVLTKLDGDTRGGAALSIRETTGKPIKFSSIGEKLNDIEPFYPDRMASRILGMGDVLTIVEKAQATYSEKELKELEKKMKENTFTLQDFMTQMEQIKKMGNMDQLIAMVPGLSQQLRGQKLEANDEILDSYRAIIQSMTKKERFNPSILKSSHKIRIAKGSGKTVAEINRMLKQFEQSKEMMKRMGSGKKGMKMPF